jgi:hypothetical protein
MMIIFCTGRAERILFLLGFLVWDVRQDQLVRQADIKLAPHYRVARQEDGDVGRAQMARVDFSAVTSDNSVVSGPVATFLSTPIEQGYLISFMHHNPVVPEQISLSPIFIFLDPTVDCHYTMTTHFCGLYMKCGERDGPLLAHYLSAKMYLCLCLIMQSRHQAACMCMSLVS